MNTLKALTVVLMLLPALAVAKMTERMIELEDGSIIKVFLFDARDGSEGPWPLSVVIPGGNANEYIARAQFWLGYELANRGWAIAVPVSPDSSSFFGRNGEKIPQVISRLQNDMQQIRGGKSLLVGVSNGGSSALEIASTAPEMFYGVVAVPGIVREGQSLDNMNGLPVYIRIGENDMLRWDRRLPGVIEKLEDVDARVNAGIVPGANHVFPLDWEELQPWIEGLDIE